MKISRRQLAEEIAGSLFVNGAGQHAERLVLTVDGPPERDLGGWSLTAAVDVIEKALRGVAVS